MCQKKNMTPKPVHAKLTNMLGYLKLLFRKRILPIQKIVSQTSAAARAMAHTPSLAEADATDIEISQILPSTHLW